MMVAMKTW